VDAQVVDAAEFQITKAEPGGAIEANFEAIKARVAEIVAVFDGVVVTPDYLPQAKKDRAYLNNLSRSLNQKRIDMEKRYMEPVVAFKQRVAELDAPIREASAFMDTQIKALEEQEKAEKRSYLVAHYEEYAGALVDIVPFERIEDSKWTNKTCDLKAAFGEIEAIVEKIAADDAALDGLNLEYHKDAKIEYFETLDMARAIARNNQLVADAERVARLEEQKAANLAALAPEPPAPEPELAAEAVEVREWLISFSGTREQRDTVIAALKDLGLHGTVK
jgi:hypothetical protein